MAADAILAATFEARAAAWRLWGDLEEDVLGHLLNPTFMGGPRWPAARQAYRVARRDAAVLVASDGLTEPFDAGQGPTGVNGFGLECFAVSSDPIPDLAGSWLLDVVRQVSQLAAGLGDLADRLARGGLLTTEIHDVRIPSEDRHRFVTTEGRVGVMLGLTAPPIPSEIGGPLSGIRLVGVKLLTLEELSFVLDRRDAGRRELAARFPPPLLDSSLSRPSAAPGT
jgi:hypothetical protein